MPNDAERIDALRRENAALGQECSRLARLRDQWRGYAYGHCPKPTELFDADVPRPQTKIDKLEAELAALCEKAARLGAGRPPYER